MPNIRDYTSQVDSLKPTEMGVDAATMEARRVGSFYDQAGNAIKGAADDMARASQQHAEAVGDESRSVVRIAGSVQEAGDQAVKYESHREIVAGMPLYAKLQDTATNAWNGMADGTDPNDTSIAGRYHEQLNDQLQDFVDSFHTDEARNWAQGRADALRQHMFEKTSADVSKRANDAMVTGLESFKNTTSNTVFSDPTPHTLDMALRNTDATVAALADSSPALSFDQKVAAHTGMTQHIKEEITKAWVFGAAKANPDATMQVLQSGKYNQFITLADAKSIMSAAKTERDQDRSMQDRQDKINFSKSMNDFESSFWPDNPNDPPKLPDNAVQQLMKFKGMPGASLPGGDDRLRSAFQTMEAIRNRNDKGESDAKVSQSTMRDLIPRIGATDDTRITDPTQITSLFHDGKLTTPDYKTAIGEYQSAKTPDGEALARDRSDFFKSFSSTFDPGMDLANTKFVGGHSAEASQKLYIAQQDAMRQEGVLRKQGQDPHLVYDPRSQYYFGAAANVAKYQRPLTDVMHDQTSPPPDRPKAFPPASQWDPAKGYWYVMQNGKKFRVDPDENK